VVGRLSKGRWNDRATAGIVHPWHRFRDVAPPGQESRRGKTSAGKPRPSSTAVDDDARNVYRQLHGPQLPTHTEGLDSRTLSPYPQPSPLSAFGTSRLCDIGSFDLQRFVLQKIEGGLGWESANHLRNLMSKIFALAKQWGYYNGDNRQARSSFRRSKRSGGNTFCSPGRLRACSACSRSL